AQLFGGGNSAATFGLVLLIAAISVAVAIFGHQTIKVLETYGAVTFALLSAALFVFLAPQFHWTQGPAASGSDYAGAFVLGFMTCFALVASWYPFASDYSRYLPAASPTRAVTLWPVAGIAIPAYAVLISDFHVAYEDFLILTYLWAPAWAAVVLLSFFVFEGKSRPGLALAAWLAGTATSLLFVNYANLFGNVFAGTRFFNDGLTSALHGADLSGVISVGVAAIDYWTGRRFSNA